MKNLIFKKVKQKDFTPNMLTTWQSIQIPFNSCFPQLYHHALHSAAADFCTLCNVQQLLFFTLFTQSGGRRFLPAVLLLLFHHFQCFEKWKQYATSDLYQNHFDTVFEGSRTPSTHFTTAFSPFSLGDPVKENEAKVNCALPPANFEDIKELHKRISYKVQTSWISWLRRLTGYESLV